MFHKALRDSSSPRSTNQRLPIEVLVIGRLTRTGKLLYRNGLDWGRESNGCDWWVDWVLKEAGLLVLAMWR